MPRTIICSPCSREKDPRDQWLPAQERYLGAHIRRLGAEAQQRNLGFFVVSGKHGLIRGEELIAYYDLLLTADLVPPLVKMVKMQLDVHNIGAIHFYAKFDKPNWQPYIEVMEQATQAMGVQLHRNQLLATD